jgi:hypothetical protein
MVSRLFIFPVVVHKPHAVKTILLTVIAYPKNLSYLI